MKIVENYNTKIPFNIRKAVEKSVAKVPPQHLIGIDSIVLLDEVTHKKYKEEKVAAIYRRDPKTNKAVIEIAVKELYREMPRFLFLLPWFKTHMLASTLYHEIGHHYAQFTHGISKEKSEKSAEQYGENLIKASFKKWRPVFIIFKPIIKILRAVVDRVVERSRYPGGGGGHL